ncbi:hypothetical protein KAR91_00835 [Candidatus Pacearchaeota archaeon]|nr:hypothetical protein [Candidatus Pacearchaeota archaeon]
MKTEGEIKAELARIEKILKNYDREGHGGVITRGLIEMRQATLMWVLLRGL